jgi:hypothetical protein
MICPPLNFKSHMQPNHVTFDHDTSTLLPYLMYRQPAEIFDQAIYELLRTVNDWSAYSGGDMGSFAILGTV